MSKDNSVWLNDGGIRLGENIIEVAPSGFRHALGGH